MLFSALYKHQSLQCLALDGRQSILPFDDIFLASLLRGTPNLKLILGRAIDPDSHLERYRKDDRVLCDPYPQTAREMPELTGVAHFFSFENNVEARMSSEQNAV